MGKPVIIELGPIERKRPRAVSLLARPRKRLKGGKQAQREEFECILEYARNAANQDPLILLSLVRMIGRVVQAKSITEVLRHPQDKADCDFEPRSLLFDTTVPLTADEYSFNYDTKYLSDGH